jgi:hypothetical protein
LQQHALYRTAEDNKKLQTNRQKKPAETNNKTSKSVRQVWANCVLQDYDDDDDDNDDDDDDGLASEIRYRQTF